MGLCLAVVVLLILVQFILEDRMIRKKITEVEEQARILAKIHNHAIDSPDAAPVNNSATPKRRNR